MVRNDQPLPHPRFYEDEPQRGIVNMEQIEKLTKDVEDLKRGQEEIRELLSELCRDTENRFPTAEHEISEFRDMVRRGADPHAAFKDIQKRKSKI